MQKSPALKTNSIRKYILDILFPIRCLGCRKEQSWICNGCSKKIPIIADQSCPVCESIRTPDGRVCFYCKKTSSLDGMLVCTSYGNSLAIKAVHLFKYSCIPEIGIPLGSIMLKKIQTSELPLPDLIIPLPLHPKRLRWRGFNQSKILAEIISKNIIPLEELPLAEDVLIRTTNTKCQMGIAKIAERKDNMRGAFAVTDKKSIRDKTVLLVDDICTTGSTIFECARVLKNAGAKNIFAIVIARQEFHKKI